MRSFNSIEFIRADDSRSALIKYKISIKIFRTKDMEYLDEV